MASTCILCLMNPPIANSHIFPKFVIRRLKAGNVLQTLIHSDALNKVFQDGWKEDYLCANCEQKFSRLEHSFCQNVYDPFLACSPVKLNYGSELGLFAASLAFRYIRFAIDKNPSKSSFPALMSLYENLRKGLLADSLSDIAAHSYVQFLFPIKSVDRFPPGVNTYFFEAVDGELFTHTVPQSPEFWLVYLKLPGLFFITSASDLRQVYATNPAVLVSHEILCSGILDSNSQSGKLSMLVEDIFCGRAAEIQVNYSKLPYGRISKMSQKIANTTNKEQYRAHRTYLLDKQLLSDFEAKYGKQGSDPKK